MVDSIDEDYRIEKLPHASSGDRRQLIAGGSEDLPVCLLRHRGEMPHRPCDVPVGERCPDVTPDCQRTFALLHGEQDFHDAIVAVVGDEVDLLHL